MGHFFKLPRRNKMELTKDFPTDAKKSKEGVEIQIGEAFFILTYYGSTQSQLIFYAMIEKFKSSMKPDDAVIAAMHQTLIDHVVLGWKGVKEDGVLLEYSKETLSRILKEYGGLDTKLMEKANDIDNYRKEKKEEVEKN
jgi:hypothetical protein